MDMSSSHLAGGTRGRPVADFSADFEVEDFKKAPRSGRDKEADNGNLGNSPPPPRWQKQSKASKPGSLSSQSSGSLVSKQPIADLDPHRLSQRQKQVDFGKNTIGYQRYLKLVPKNKRRRRGEQWLDPVTPDIHQNISKRCFDGQIKVWRRALHKYDDHPEEEQQIRPVPYAERTRQRSQTAEEVAVQSAVPSSPTNSSRSRGSLDGYLEPQLPDTGRKRCFERAFDHVAGGNPHPSKLLTSPAGPKPVAPQSAPPATAADAEPAPTPVGRCLDPPTMVGRGGGPPASLPKAPQTAPPAAIERLSAGTTADILGGKAEAGFRLKADPRLVPKGSRAQETTVGEDLFREWDDEDYAGLQPLDDDELDRVQL